MMQERTKFHMRNGAEDCPPVLLVAFNRPDLTRQVFERIRMARPSQLFFAVDGPRHNHPGDLDKCAAVRSIIEDVDWACDVQTLFRKENLGCKLAPSSAITWFFSHVEEGIILEDDCLPDATFFRFCGGLLEYYRNDTRVMMISGNNFQPDGWQSSYSYYYSMYPQTWGWASWRRAWRHFDIEMTLWPELSNNAWLSYLFGEVGASTYWTWIFDICFNNAIDAWDYQWLYSCWVQNGLSIAPSINLVTNIGFGEQATHTTNTSSPQSCVPAQSMDFPLRHPGHMVRDCAADAYTLRHIYSVRSVKRKPLYNFRQALHKYLKAILQCTKPNLFSMETKKGEVQN